MQNQTRVLLVEKHKLLFDGVERVIALAVDLTLIGMVSVGESELNTYLQSQFDVLLLSFNNLEQSDNELFHSWRKHNPHAKIIILLADSDEANIFDLFSRGANGCFLKEETPERLAEAIRAVRRGETWLSQQLTSKLIEDMSLHATGIGLLTKQELALLRLLAQEKTDEEIAQILHCSTRTVRRNLQHIYDKLGVHGRLGAVYEAGRQQLLGERVQSILKWS